MDIYNTYTKYKWINTWKRYRLFPVGFFNMFILLSLIVIVINLV